MWSVIKRESPNKDKTGVGTYYYRGHMAVRMRQVRKDQYEFLKTSYLPHPTYLGQNGWARGGGGDN